MSINLYLAIALLGALCFVAPIIIFVTIKNKKALKIVVGCLLVIYLAILGIGVFSNVTIGNGKLLVDFTPRGEFFKAASFIYYNFSLVNICVNLFMFLPLGMSFFVLFDKHKFIWTVCLSLLFSALIEFGQFALPVARTVELTDLVYNTLSGILGFLIFWAVEAIKVRAHKKDKMQSL